MKTSARWLIVIALLVGVSSFASAEIKSYTGDVTFTEINQSGTISIPKWNPAKGTLNSISIVFWDSGQADLTFTANSGAITSAYGSIVRGYDVTGVGFANFSKMDLTAHGTYFTNIPAEAVSGPENIHFNHANAATFILSDAASLDLYKGAGNVSYAVSNGGFPPSYFSNTTAVTGGNLDANFANSNTKVGVKVTYDFTPNQPGVPEPSSLALLPMALTGLMFWRRRRIA